MVLSATLVTGESPESQLAAMGGRLEWQVVSLEGVELAATTLHSARDPHRHARRTFEVVLKATSSD